jgi:hypothetical protein
MGMAGFLCDVVALTLGTATLPGNLPERQLVLLETQRHARCPFASSTVCNVFGVSLHSRRNAATGRAMIDSLQEAAREQWGLTSGQ